MRNPKPVWIAWVHVDTSTAYVEGFLSKRDAVSFAAQKARAPGPFIHVTVHKYILAPKRARTKRVKDE